MTVSEFITNTGVFPDFPLYFAACQEYEKKNADGSPAWDSIEAFCDAYKYNLRGLAETVQRIANEKVQEKDSEISRLKAANASLREDAQALLARISEMRKPGADRRSE